MDVVGLSKEDVFIGFCDYGWIIWGGFKNAWLIGDGIIWLYFVGQMFVVFINQDLASLD